MKHTIDINETYYTCISMKHTESMKIYNVYTPKCLIRSREGIVFVKNLNFFEYSDLGLRGGGWGDIGELGEQVFQLKHLNLIFESI